MSSLGEYVVTTKHNVIVRNMIFYGIIHDALIIKIQKYTAL